MEYNVRKKIFPDGTAQYVWHEFKEEVGYTLPPKEEKEEGEKEHIPDRERSQKVSRSRAVQAVYDICQSNPWTWFLTLTFDPQKVDSFDYDKCVEAIILFTKKLRYWGIQYVVVPEKHPTSGRWHFHGLLYDPDGQLRVVPARNAQGKLLVDGKKRQVYNVSIYEYGFSTVTKVSNETRAGGYLCKYVSKDMFVPDGRKRYWASRGLKRPEVKYLDMPESMIIQQYAHAGYKKIIETDKGRCIFYEIKPKGGAS